MTGAPSESVDALHRQAIPGGTRRRPCDKARTRRTAGTRGFQIPAGGGRVRPRSAKKAVEELTSGVRVQMDSQYDPPKDEMPATPDTPVSAEEAERQAAKSRRFKILSTAATIVVIVALGVLAAEHVAKKVDFDQVWAYMHGLPMALILEAVAFTMAGYFMLTLYDVSALYHLRIKVPYPKVALASFSGYAISNNVGWAVISGASVRYRVYSTSGLTAGTVAKILVFSTTTFTLGVCFMGALGMLVGPHPVATLLRMPDWGVQVMAGATLLALVAVCGITSITHKPLRIGSWTLEIPGTKMVISQIVISSIEIVLAGAALWALLPAGINSTFAEFVGVFCAAMVVSMVSHVPGGLGVFETIIIVGLGAQGDDVSSLLGAILAFRFVYFVLPLILGGLLLLGFEVNEQRGNVRRLIARLRGR